MPKHYNLLKGTVSRLTIIEEPGEMRSDHIGLIAFIGLTIVGLFGAAAALIGSLTTGSIKLEGQRFYCYVGSKRVEGKLVRAGFKEGDYVEMVVKPEKYETYRAYAVRVPSQHALYFPRYIGTSTFESLKYCSIIIGSFCLLTFLLLLVMSVIDGDFFETFTLSFTICFGLFIFITFVLFFMLGGRYSFISNKIYAVLGYPKPWRFNSLNEDFDFRKMNRKEDPLLFDDPQTPEFKKLTKFTPFASYYIRTPTVPDWVNVIDEKGKFPKDDVIVIRDEE